MRSARVFHPGDRHGAGNAPARLMFLGGAALEGPRYIWWNFVSSCREGSSKAKKIGRREDSRRCWAKQSSFRFPNPK
jgi:hypothetical protein